MNQKELERMIKGFWEGEYLATRFYRYMASKSTGERAETFLKISEMEAKHGRYWNEDIAPKKLGKSFKPSIRLKLRFYALRLLALFLPLAFLIHLLESDERAALMNYSRILEELEDDEHSRALVEEIMRDEIQHEHSMAEMLIGDETKLSRIKDAIYGMTDSLVEILALVIGLASIMNDPFVIGLAGLIAAIGGTFSMTSGAYLSVKSQNDIYEGKVSAIDIKEKVGPEYLEEDLRIALKEKGLDDKSASQVVKIIGPDREVITSLLTSIAIEETYDDPKNAAITTGIYYVLGAIPAVAPYFLGFFVPITPIGASIIAIVLCAIISFVAGIFTAVLSGIDIKSKAFKNMVITIGAAAATFFIGTIARTFLGVEV